MAYGREHALFSHTPLFRQRSIQPLPTFIQNPGCGFPSVGAVVLNTMSPCSQLPVNCPGFRLSRNLYLNSGNVVIANIAGQFFYAANILFSSSHSKHFRQQFCDKIIIHCITRLCNSFFSCCKHLRLNGERCQPVTDCAYSVNSSTVASLSSTL